MSVRQWAVIALMTGFAGLIGAACSTDAGITVVDAPAPTEVTPETETPDPGETPTPATEEPTPDTGETPTPATETPTPATEEPTPTTEAPTPTAEPPEDPPSDRVAALGNIRSLAGLEPGGPDYVDYVDVTDDLDLITVSVPVEWVETDGRQWEPEGDGVLLGPALTASPDISAWREGWGTPGIFIAASDMLGFGSPAELLDDNQFGGSCQLDGRRPYDDGVYVGEYDLWLECGDEGSAFAVLAAQPADGSYLILAEFLAVTDRDWDAIANAVVSFLARIE